MADHRLRRAAGQPARVPAEGELHGPRLDAIVQLRRRAVVVQVPDLADVDVRLLHRQRHGPSRLFTRFIHAHAMVGVTRRAIAGHLGVNVCTARARRLLPFHHEHPRALGEHETVPVLRERPRGALRQVVELVGHDAHDAEAGHHSLGDRGVRAAGDDVVSHAQLQIPVGIAKRVRRRRAAGGDQV